MNVQWNLSARPHDQFTVTVTMLQAPRVQLLTVSLNLNGIETCRYEV